MREGAEDTPETPRAYAVTLALLAVVAVAGTGLRWWDPWDSRASFDSLQYARVAYRQMGRSPTEAAASAVRLRCDAWARTRPAPAWVPVSLPRPGALDEHQCSRPGYVPSTSPPYDAIFDSRPGYPWAVAALHPLIGGGAFALVTLGSAAAAVLLVGVVATLLGARRWAAAAAAVAVLALPSGLYLTRIGPDGLVGLGTAVALSGAVIAVGRGRTMLGAVVLLCGLLLLVPVKVPVAVALGACLVPPALWVAVRSGRARRPAAVVGGVSAAGAVLGLLTSWALGWAGLQTTLQDLATKHFLLPRAPHPYGVLLSYDRRLLLTVAPGHHGLLVVVALAALAALGLVRSRPAGLLVVGAGAAGLLLVAVHPVATESARLAMPSWIAVALGVALLGDDALRRRGTRTAGS